VKDFIGPCGVPVANCHPTEGLSDPPTAAKAYEAGMMASKLLTKANGGPSLGFRAETHLWCFGFRV